MGKIGFLHTSPVHVPTFETLLSSRLENGELHHTVDEALLAYAMEHGCDDHVENQLKSYLQALADAGCHDLVCTCSTLGVVAEEVTLDGVQIIRGDRPMAATAVASGHIILMAAAIKSTLAPTRQLLLDESQKQGRPIRIIECLVESSWDYFLKGDQAGYAAEIAAGIRSCLQGNGLCEPKLTPEVIVFAQASMAPAKLLLEELSQPILTSPELCADFFGNEV